MARSETSTEYENRIDPKCGGMHLVVFGKSGSGKSALCNQLVEKTGVDLVFPVGQSLKAVTENSQTSLRTEHGYTVLDTPGRDSDMDIAQSRLALQKIIVSLQRHIKEDNATSPQNEHIDSGNRNACNAILIFCVRCDVRYSRAEHNAYLQLKDLWGNPEDFCQRLVVAFTMGDTLAGGSKDEDDTAPESPSKLMAPGDTDATAVQSIKTDFEDDKLTGERIQKEHMTQEDKTGLGDGDRSLNTVPDPNFASVPQTTAQERTLNEKLKGTGLELKQLIEDVGGRYILFNNKEGHKDRRAVRKLLDMVQTMEVSESPCFKRKEKREEYYGQNNERPIAGIPYIITYNCCSVL